MKKVTVPDPSQLGTIQKLCELSQPYVPPDGYEQLFVQAMKESIRWHQGRSSIYKALTERKQFDADQLVTISDTARIPYLLASFFKLHEIVSIPRDQVIAHLTSSGTTGQKSQMFFDQWSMSAGQR